MKQRYILAAVTALLMLILSYQTTPRSSQTKRPASSAYSPPAIHSPVGKAIQPRSYLYNHSDANGNAAPHVKGEFIVTIASSLPEARLDDILTETNLTIDRKFHITSTSSDRTTIKLKAADPAHSISIADLAEYPELQDVSLNYIMEAYQSNTGESAPLPPQTIPDDPEFNLQWGLHTESTNVYTNDIDIDAPEAWSITPAKQEVVVAVIDTGIDYNHLDLIDNIWTNPLEVEGDANHDGFPGLKGVDDDGDGLIDEDSQGNEPYWDSQGKQINPLYLYDLTDDDDENGYPDDIYGIDTGDGDSDPMDIHNSHDVSGHGTHVAGIIAAVHNKIGTAGVAPKVKIMAIKGFDNLNGQLTTDHELAALEYILAMKARGVNIVAINASYGCKACANPNQKGAIAEIIAQGIVFVAAAGNGNTDNDILPIYPASYDLENIISVTATMPNDDLDTYSNFGLTTVHLGAPGHGILSTDLTTADDRTIVKYRSGTSMAAAFVSGSVAVLAAVYPFENASQRWQRIMDGTDLISGPAAETISGGRLNLYGALASFQTCAGDTRGDGDSDGLDLANFINGNTVFSLSEMAASFGGPCSTTPTTYR